jgi:hypothetical protein
MCVSLWLLSIPCSLAIAESVISFGCVFFGIICQLNMSHSRHYMRLLPNVCSRVWRLLISAVAGTALQTVKRLRTLVATLHICLIATCVPYLCQV